jgi:ribosomal protein L37AE/L43A
MTTKGGGTDAQVQDARGRDGVQRPVRDRRSRAGEVELEPVEAAVRKVIDCPRCEKGTVKRRTGDMWWQVQHLRCSYCGGTGRIYEDASDEDGVA